MESIETLRKRIQNTEQLHSVVRTMKAIAAININHFQEAVFVLGDFFQTVELGFQIILQHQAGDVSLAQQEPGEKTGVILLGSDQGMVGQFNQAIVSHTVREMRRFDIPTTIESILGIGIRGVNRLEQRGLKVERVMAVPSSLSGVTPTVQDILLHIRRWREEQDIVRVLIFYNSFERGSSYQPTTMQILPVSPEWLGSLKKRKWPNKVLPTFRADWRELFAQLVQQFFFVIIYRAIVESLASENASRLAAMQVAEKNIEERLEEITLKYNQLRQSSITNELLDIITGVEALREE